jgi:hypothetical protein
MKKGLIIGIVAVVAVAAIVCGVIFLVATMHQR